MVKKLLERYMKNNCKKQRFTIEKVTKKKLDKLYVKLNFSLVKRL